MTKVTAPSANLRSLNEEQLFDLGTKSGIITQGIEATAPFLAAQAETLNDLTVELGIKLGRIVRDPLLEERRQADRRRDLLKVRLYETTRIALDDPESDSVRQAAEVIQAILDRRPSGFQNLIYSENSTELGVLLNDLAEAEAVKAAATAGLTKWVNALRAAQDSFDALEKQIIAKERTETKPRTVEEIRRDLSETLRLLLTNLAWGANRYGSESDYTGRLRAFSLELKDIATSEKTRQTNREKREKREAGKAKASVDKLDS